MQELPKIQYLCNISITRWAPIPLEEEKQHKIPTYRCIFEMETIKGIVPVFVGCSRKSLLYQSSHIGLLRPPALRRRLACARTDVTGSAWHIITRQSHHHTPWGLCGRKGPSRQPYTWYSGVITSSVDSGNIPCLLYTSPSPRDQRGSRMPSSA